LLTSVGVAAVGSSAAKGADGASDSDAAGGALCAPLAWVGAVTIGALAAELEEQLDAAHLGHVPIGQHQIRRSRADRVERELAVGGLGGLAVPNPLGAANLTNRR
jgi:hypothetical protein